MRRTWTNNSKFTYHKYFRKNNNSQAKTFHYKEKYIPPYPIKPYKYIIPKDLNLQKIFSTMLKLSIEQAKYYSFSSILIDNNYRKIILKQIREYFLYSHIDYKIYFKTILLFDIILVQNEKYKLLNSIEEITLGALILSIKFNYDENKMFSMKKFVLFYGEQIFNLNDIIEIERKALKTINYFLNFASPMCFLEFFMLNGIIYNIDYLNQNDYYKIYNQIEVVLDKIMEDSNNYLKYNFFYLACSVVSYCRNIFNLEKWPLSLKNVFSIDFNEFQSVYKANFEIKEKIVENENRKEIKTYNNKKNVYNNSTYNYNNKDIIINGNNNVVLLDFKNLNQNIKNYKINSNNIYKKNNFKTINHYNNNIINININNVSLNSIYSSNNNNNNSNIENYINKIDNYNLYRYNSSNNSNYKFHNKNKSLNNIYDNNFKKNLSKNKYENKCENINKNNTKLTSNLVEIKEIKDLNERKTYFSPKKRKRIHYYVLKNDEKNKDDNENNKKDNYMKNSDNIENKKEERVIRRKRKHYKYKTTNINNDFKEDNNNNNHNNDNINKNFFNSINSLYNNENDNNKNNILKIKNQSSNEHSSNNEEEKNENKKENNIKSNNNVNILNYSIKNFSPYEQENKNEVYINNTKSLNFISNIKKFNLINSNDSEKTEFLADNKCESSRIIKINNQNNFIISSFNFTDEKDKIGNRYNDTSIKKDKNNINYKSNLEDEKERSKIKRNKIENKIKYNDLIKYKLSKLYSNNKRK